MSSFIVGRATHQLSPIPFFSFFLPYVPDLRCWTHFRPDLPLYLGAESLLRVLGEESRSLDFYLAYHVRSSGLSINTGEIGIVVELMRARARVL